MERSSGDVCEDSIREIRRTVQEGSSFDEACSLIGVRDPGLREFVINASLKAIIAEMHLSQGLPLKTLAMRLRLPLSRLLNAKKGMQEDIGRLSSPGHRKGSPVAET